MVPAIQRDRRTQERTELGSEAWQIGRSRARHRFVAHHIREQLRVGEVFQARRGPIARDDYLLTRLLELVVHGDDLQRALGRTDAPLLPEAVAAVSDALTSAYEERAGSTPAEGGLSWIRVATGRVPSSDPHLPLL